MTEGTDTRVADRYSLRNSLGRGGMGEVWLARDELLHRDVAVKVIGLPRALTREQIDAAKERVLREARAAARINHANAVTVYDVFEEDDRAFIVMELVDAPTLADRVASDGPLAPVEAARLGIEILNALEAAHREGITHRDVKPSNVMLPAEGLKLADFGIASIGDDPRLTETGLVLGSPSFMAPEQATSGTTGPEADLWALGATLFYAVESKPPFDKGHSIATLTSVVHDELTLPRSAGALGPVIAALMAKEPGDRPDAATARGLLERVARGENATTLAAPTTPTREYTRTETPPPSPSSSPRRRFPWPALVAIAAVVALGALVLANLGSDEDPSPGPEAADRQQENAEDPASSGNDTSGGEAPAATSGVYEDPTTGYRIEYPEGWDVRPIDTRTDFVDPATGSYLRIDHTDAPGPDAVAAAEQQSESFGASHDCYEELAMEPTTMAGSDNAVLWEYAYCEDGAELHAYNLQFVLPDESYGFALNFQTHEEDWEASQGLWEAFQGSFEPPGG